MSIVSRDKGVDEGVGKEWRVGVGKVEGRGGQGGE